MDEPLHKNRPEQPCFGRCIDVPSNKLLKFEFKKRSDSVKCCLVTAIITMLFLSVILPSVIYSIVDASINDQVVVDSTEDPNYDTWQTNTDPNSKHEVTFKLYFFEVQNKDDVTYNASLPVVTEVGPYTFKEYFNKLDVTFLDGGKQVQFITQKYFIFDPENALPGVSLDDKLMLPYLPAIGFEFLFGKIPEVAQQKLRDAEEAALYSVLTNITAQIDDTYANNPIRRTLLDTEVQNVINALDDYNNQSTPSAQFFKSLMCRLPSYVSDGENNATPFWPNDPASAYFGYLEDPLLSEVQVLLDQLNLSDTVPWTTSVPGCVVNWTTPEDTLRRRAPNTLHTGKGDPRLVANYVRYNNMTEQYVCQSPEKSQNMTGFDPSTQFPACDLFQFEWTEKEADAKGWVPVFGSDYANRVAGTDSTMFGRPVTSDLIQVYASDIYRTGYMEHKKDVRDWHNNIKLKRYGPQLKDFENATTNPTQAQYFQFGPMGQENVSNVGGIPTFVSYPHYLDAEAKLVSGVKGISPKPEIHSTYIDIEPQTGLLVRARQRVQTNYYVSSYDMPVVDSSTANSFNAMCLNETRAQGIDCHGINTMLMCLASPSWTLKDDGVFFPYAWVEESLTLPQSEADDLSNTLFWAEEFAAQVQFWSFVSAGILFAMLVGMLGESYLRADENCVREESAYAPTTREEGADDISKKGHLNPITSQAEH